MIKKIKGIVVKEIAYKDTSKIIEVLTACGIYSIVARGAKKVIRLGASSYLVNLCTQVYKQNNNSNIYNILLTGITKIDSGINTLGIVNIVEIKLLKYLGLKLNLDACVVCGSKDITSLSLDYSGYLCKNCSKVSTDGKVLKLINLYDKVDINKLDSFNVSNEYLFILDKFMDEYYLKYTGLYLDSKKFFREMLS